MTSGDETLVAVLAERAALAPHRPAVSDGDRTLTYQELDREAGRLAEEIVRTCGRAREPVGVLLDQGVEAVVSLYGVMKAGKIALPLDNMSPNAVLTDVLSHAGAPLVVTDEDGRRLLGGGIESLVVGDMLGTASDGPCPTGDVSPDDPASIFYTSGSTGRPKGVVVSHGAQVRSVRSWCSALGLRSDDQLALLFHYSFGASRVSLYGAVATGAHLRVYDVRRAGIPVVAHAIDDDGVTFAHCSASLLRSLLTQLTEGPNFPRLRLQAIGAEGLHRRDIARFRRHLWPGCSLAYFYGLSEAGPVTALFVDRATELGDGLLPVGAPLPGKRVTIAEPDAHGVGEIVVGGEGLASGYWRDQVQTDNQFGVDPDDPARSVFHSGDFGRLRPDGMLEYHGRIDTRVKLRGYSVDLAEVERALLDVAPLAEVAVVLDKTGRPRLVAHVVPEPAHPACDPVRLRTLLADRLPAYMVPTAIVVLDALPRTNRGKVDTAALPPAPAGRPPLETPFVAPRDDLERAIGETWEQVLEVRPIGVDDDFTQLGGDSLAAAESLTRLQVALGREVPPAVMLEAATVAEMADLLRRGGEKQWITPLIPLRARGSRPPFFCVHGGGGHVLLLQPLAECLSSEQPFYAFQLVGAPAQRALRKIERLAALYVQELRRAQPRGPYLLGGFSFGGEVALEMAHQLAVAGDPTALVVLIDTTSPDLVRRRLAQQPLRRLANRFMLEVRWVAWRAGWPNWRLAQWFFKRGGRPPKWRRPNLLCRRATRRYHPRGYDYDGPVLLFRSEVNVEAGDLGWGALVTGELELVDVPGNHRGMLAPPNVSTMAEHLEAALARAAAPSSPVPVGHPVVTRPP